MLFRSTPFLSSLLISLYYKSIKGVFYTRTNISIGRDCLIGMPVVTDALSTILRLLGGELEVASWLIEARSIMEPSDNITAIVRI